MSELQVEDWKLEAQAVVQLCRKKCDKYLCQVRFTFTFTFSFTFEILSLKNIAKSNPRNIFQIVW